MEQTELLWQYQQADMAADAFETEIKRNPNRLALKKTVSSWWNSRIPSSAWSRK